MNKYKRLFNDSIIYLFGNIGSKIVSVIMVSFYTFFLNKNDYGGIDVTQTAIALMLPVTTLCIHSAVLRFTLDDKYDKSKIITSGFVYLCISVFSLTIPFCLFLNMAKLITGNIILIIILTILEAFNVLFGQICRGLGKTKLFANSGIIFTIVISISNIIMLGFLKVGINGYYTSLILGYLISGLILFFLGNIKKYIKFSYTSKVTICEMLKYSFPIILNSMIWWIISGSDKFQILYILGKEKNSLYAIAEKIPVILLAFTRIFIQAWQVSAMIESDSADKDEFYSCVFRGLMFVVFLIISLILATYKFVLKIAIAPGYYDSWIAVPFLLLGAAFSSFSDFLDANYLAMKKTTGASKTLVIGAFVNIVLNYFLIHYIGFTGAAIATAISFAIVWILRMTDTESYVKISFSKTIFIESLLVIMTQIVFIYSFNEPKNILFGFFCIVMLLLINKKMAKNIFKKIRVYIADNLVR